MDGPSIRPTDTPSYKVASSRLKRKKLSVGQSVRSPEKKRHDLMCQAPKLDNNNKVTNKNHNSNVTINTVTNNNENNHKVQSTSTTKTSYNQHCYKQQREQPQSTINI